MGICLSGGGIRAASFALGAVQALHHRKQLLFGATRADYLAAVSGGSYVAATSTSIANQIAHDRTSSLLAPLDKNSPEASHILENGQYLKEWGSAWRVAAGLVSAVAAIVAWFWLGPVAAGCFVLGLGILSLRGWWATAVLFGFFALINLAGFASLFLWASVMLVGAGELVTSSPADVLLDPESFPAWADPWLWVLLGSVTLLGVRLLLRTIYRTGHHWLLRVAGLVLIFVGAPSLLYALTRDSVELLLVVAAMAVALLVFTQRLRVRGARPPVLFWGVLALVVQLGGLVVLAIGTDRMSGSFTEDSAALPALVIFAALPVSVVLARVSLHHLNRDRLATCFCVERAPDGADVRVLSARSTKLSDLRSPGPEGIDRAFPRLLICATANIDVRDRHGGGWRRYQSFMFTPERCGEPGHPKAWFKTEKLEAGCRPVALHKEPTLGLMTAVACSGAAAAPGMGAKTRSAVRSLFALINLRLGTWLANPYSDVIRGEVDSGPNWWKPGKFWNRRTALGNGYDEFVPELFGLQRTDAPRIYISDGGHYDNLGLLALLEARCEVIWCVDSQADRNGRASQLENTIELAIRENLIDDIALRPPTDDGDSPYAAFAGKDGTLKSTHATFDVSYRCGGSATLIVIKLGLTAQSDPELKAYNERDRRWLGALRSVPFFLFARYPFDQTFVRIAFDRERADNYRRLGFDNTVRAMDDPDTQSD